MNPENVVLITGANSGIGKAVATAIAQTKNQVVMVCRDTQRGSKALEEVKSISKNNSVELMICDLGSLKSIEQFCDDFKRKYNKLNVLINNAGVVMPGYHKTEDGFELHFGVNHLGHFFLTNKLLDVLIQSAPARIINVSSGAHKIGKIHFDDINLEKSYSFWKAYSQSKLANILFTYSLAENLKEKNVTANCLHPGAVATNMGINRETGFGTLITKILKPFFLTPSEGAQTAIHLALSKEIEGVSGKYFYKKEDVKSSKLSYSTETAKKLWHLSAKLVGLQK